MTCLELFVFLQLLDFLTTVMGFRLGGQEMSPFIRWVMQIGPVHGLIVVKAGAMVLAGMCIWLERKRVLDWVNYFFAGVVLWNMAMILRALTILTAH